MFDRGIDGLDGKNKLLVFLETSTERQLSSKLLKVVVRVCFVVLQSFISIYSGDSVHSKVFLGCGFFSFFLATGAEQIFPE